MLYQIELGCTSAVGTVPISKKTYCLMEVSSSRYEFEYRSLPITDLS